MQILLCKDLKFKPFNPSTKQFQHFIQTLILPMLMYNAELWFYSCTEGGRYVSDTF